MLQLRNALRVQTQRHFASSSCILAAKKQQKQVASKKVTGKKVTVEKVATKKAAPKKVDVSVSAIDTEAIEVKESAVARVSKELTAAYLKMYQNQIKAYRANRGPVKGNSYKSSDRKLVDDYLKAMSRKTAHRDLIGTVDPDEMKLGPMTTLNQFFLTNKKLSPTYVPPASPHALFYTLEGAKTLAPFLKSLKKIEKFSDLTTAERTKLALASKGFFESPPSKDVKVSVEASKKAFEELNRGYLNELAGLKVEEEIKAVAKPKIAFWAWVEATDVMAKLKKPGMIGPDMAKLARESWGKQPSSVVDKYNKIALADREKYEVKVQALRAKKAAASGKPVKKPTLFATFCDQNTIKPVTFNSTAHKKELIAAHLQQNRRAFNKLSKVDLDRLQVAVDKSYEKRVQDRQRLLENQ